jgi:uncharacterized delta-60 repeat protein
MNQFNRFFLFPFLLFIGLNICSNSLAFAQQLDTSFGINGYVPSGGPTANSQLNSGLAYVAAIQSDGKIVVGIDKWNPNATDLFFYTYRYNVDGTPDSTFGNMGVSRLFVGEDSRNFDLKIQPDGKIVVIGESRYCIDGICGAPQFIMMRILPNGELDTTFGNDGHLLSEDVFGTTSFYAKPQRVHVLPNNKYIIAGFTGTKPFIARLNDDGFADITYANNGVYQENIAFSSFVDLKVDDAGKATMLVRAYNYLDGIPVENNTSDSHIIQLNSAGQLQQSFGAGGKLILNLLNDDAPTSLALANNGGLIVSGNSCSASGWIGCSSGAAWLAFISETGTLTSVSNDISVPGQGVTEIKRVIDLGNNRLMVAGKIHNEVSGNFQEKALFAQVNASGDFLADFNQTGFMLFDLGSVGTTGWNGKLCNFYDFRIANSGEVYGTGYRNPTAGNTARSLLLLKLIDVPGVISTVDVLELMNLNEWSVYPNPTSSVFTIKVAENSLYNLFNSQGKLLNQGSLNAGENLLKLPENYPDGIYFIHIEGLNNSSRITKKVVKQ